MHTMARVRSLQKPNQRNENNITTINITNEIQKQQKQSDLLLMSLLWCC
jgi:hypothetical protein